MAVARAASGRAFSGQASGPSRNSEAKRRRSGVSSGGGASRRADGGFASPGNEHAGQPLHQHRVRRKAEHPRRAMPAIPRQHRAPLRLVVAGPRLQELQRRRPVLAVIDPVEDAGGRLGDEGR